MAEGSPQCCTQVRKERQQYRGNIQSSDEDAPYAATDAENRGSMIRKVWMIAVTWNDYLSTVSPDLFDRLFAGLNYRKTKLPPATRRLIRQERVMSEHVSVIWLPVLRPLKTPGTRMLKIPASG